MRRMIRQWITIVAAVMLAAAAHGNIYYVDNVSGNDSNPGTWSLPWQTLSKASSMTYIAGDELCLKRGQTYWLPLKIINVDATAVNPFTIRTWGTSSDPKPIINSQGYRDGIYLRNSSGVVIKDIEIVSDRGTAYENSATNTRYGVYIEMNNWRPTDNYSDITLTNLYIHDILSTETVESDASKTGTYHNGNGIKVSVQSGATLSNVVITKCTIERTGKVGIQLSGLKVGTDYTLKHVDILNCVMKQTGGSGMQASSTYDWMVSGNTVTNSGWYQSAAVPTYGRGSGIWPWQCENVRIEDNRFLGARGKGDSCGAHIDFNNIDVIVQYNFSYDNEGGFAEILGNCDNSIYRYNVSVNDGWRIKGQNGAEQDGKVLWLSGYVGSAPKVGPRNSYIYNNTIYVNKGSRAVFAINPLSEGVLIKNNIFYIAAGITSVNGSDDQDTDGSVFPPIDQTQVKFSNNLYNRTGIIPSDLPIQDSAPIIADPQFPYPGVLWPYGYIPGNTSAVKNTGHLIWKLPNDPFYIWTDLQVHTDMMANPVANTSEDRPDMGSIELP